jgi:hypothetical protein
LKPELKCGACRTSEKHRALFGCDADVSLTIFVTKCSTCYGLDPACPDCGGSGIKHYNRCPSSQVDQNTSDLLYWFGLIELGLNSSDLSPCDWPHDFTVLHRHYLTMRNLLDQEQFDKQKKEMDKAVSKAKAKK